MASKMAHGLMRLRAWKNRALTLLLYRTMFRRIGSRSTICSPVYMVHPENVSIGRRVYIGPSCRIETYPESSGPAPSMMIGSGVSIGHHVLLSCSQSLVIEDDVLIAGGCYIGDNNHAMNPE